MNTSEEHLIETKIASREVYHGALLRLREDTVRHSDGQQSQREYIVHPGAACVLAFSAPTRLIMVRQFRYPVGQVMLELPAGKLSANESPLSTAQRELEEETGFRAKVWHDIGLAHAGIGYSTEIIHYFVASELSQHGAKPDEGEWVDTLDMSVEAVWASVDAGTLTDSKSLVGLLLAQRRGIL